ncbi:MAG: glycosyltransferase family 2 protein, partial [Prevotella sp.]|nr:glycosyltransferase family 2 protein [Prevotella sp.]
TIGTHSASVRKKKLKYVKLPLFWRAFAFFCYRYFIRLGFLDGKEGFLWHFLQGFWYRLLADAKVFEIKKRFNWNRDKIVEYLKTFKAD